MNTLNLKPGDRIKVRRPRLLEKRPREMTVKEIREDGTILALVFIRSARGSLPMLTTTVVRPDEVWSLVTPKETK